MPQTWDENGKEITAPPTSGQSWDEQGKPISSGSNAPDDLMRQTNAAARGAGESQRATMPVLPKPEPTGPTSRFFSGALDAAKSFKPQMPSASDVALFGAGPLPSMVRHGIEGYGAARDAGQSRGESVAEGAGSLVGVNSKGVRERAERGDIAGVLGEAAVPIATTLAAEPTSRALGAAREAIRPAQQSAAESIVSPMTYENLGETRADIARDVNPERGLTREGLVGGKKSLAEEKIPQRIGELKQAANNILDNHPNGDRIIDAEPLIDKAIDDAIGRTDKVAGSTDRLENLRTALKTKYGKIQGTPREMNDLKADIQDHARGLGAYKNTQPVEASAADAMSDAASKIRGAVDAQVPEAKELNQRMSDLIDAREGIKRNIAAQRGKSPMEEMGNFHFGPAIRNTLGSAPIRTGLARFINAGNVLDVPEPVAGRSRMPPSRMLPEHASTALDFSERGPQGGPGPNQQPSPFEMPPAPPREIPTAQITQGKVPRGIDQSATVRSAAEQRMLDWLRERLPGRLSEKIK